MKWHTINEYNITIDDTSFNFYYNINSKEELTSLLRIRSINNEYHKQYYQDHKDYKNKQSSQYYLDNKEQRDLYFSNNRAKRRGWGNINPINCIFKGSELHHLHINNHIDCIYIPTELHKSIKHRYNNMESMDRINEAVLSWYFES